jgi:sugar O-acyltransferase (sialic acid O-acetyltransferase NeuD family)
MEIPLLILGSGTFALELLDIAEAAGGFKPLGFVNSVDREATRSTLAGLPIFWIDDLPFGPDDCALVAGLVTTHRRSFIQQMAEQGYSFTTLIHPSATISRRATIGTGCVINAGVVISQNTQLQPHVIINRGALIGHDIIVEPYCTVGPGANIAGGVRIGSGSYIGVGAIVRDHVEIGADAIVGAGAVVVKPVAASSLVTGLPARVVRTDVKGL